MLGFLFAVVISLTDGSLEPIKPEVVIGSLVCLGETWDLLVTRSRRRFNRDSLLAKLKASAVAWPEK